jgi:hypothetical protein
MESETGAVKIERYGKTHTGTYVAEKGWVRLVSNLGVTSRPTPLPELSSSVARIMLADLVDADARENRPSSDRAIWQRPYARR